MSQAEGNMNGHIESHGNNDHNSAPNSDNINCNNTKNNNGEKLVALYGSVYDTVSYYTDWAWGKSRTYLMPYWSTTYSGSQITDQIYISDLPSAFNVEHLKEEGFTHVLNMIIGVDSLFPSEFVYKNIPARDIESQDLAQYFLECSEFIHEAIQSEGKVLVHCSQGISRSASIVIAYLISQGMTYGEAYNLVKSKRQIINPNPGFVEQLLEWEKQVIQSKALVENNGTF